MAVVLRSGSTLPTAAHTRAATGAKFGDDASGAGSYIRVYVTRDAPATATGALQCDADADCTWSGFAVPIGAFIADADAGADWIGAATIGTLNLDADAGAQFYGRTRGFWECDSDAGAEFAGRVTEWHVSGLRMDAEAGASFTGNATGVGTLRMDADAGFEVWPRLRAIPESCLGANTALPGEEAGELSNYVY